MQIKIVPLRLEYLIKTWDTSVEQRKSYFSDGSVAYCLLVDDIPVIAGGIVNMQWKRGEAWMLSTPFFRKHLRFSFCCARNTLVKAAKEGNFKRVQATCVTAATPSLSLFKHLNFTREGIMKSSGPNGEDCFLYARLF